MVVSFLYIIFNKKLESLTLKNLHQQVYYYYSALFCDSFFIDKEHTLWSLYMYSQKKDLYFTQQSGEGPIFSSIIYLAFSAITSITSIHMSIYFMQFLHFYINHLSPFLWPFIFSLLLLLLLLLMLTHLLMLLLKRLKTIFAGCRDSNPRFCYRRQVCYQ